MFKLSRNQYTSRKVFLSAGDGRVFEQAVLRPGRDEDLACHRRFGLRPLLSHTLTTSESEPRAGARGPALGQRESVRLLPRARARAARICAVLAKGPRPNGHGSARLLPALSCG